MTLQQCLVYCSPNACPNATKQGSTCRNAPHSMAKLTYVILTLTCIPCQTHTLTAIPVCMLFKLQLCAAMYQATCLLAVLEPYPHKTSLTACRVNIQAQCTVQMQPRISWSWLHLLLMLPKYELLHQRLLSSHPSLFITCQQPPCSSQATGPSMVEVLHEMQSHSMNVI